MVKTKRAIEDHTYKVTPEEKRRYKGQWYLSLNKAGKNGPMKLRPDDRAAVMMKNRLHHEAGEPIEEPIHPGQQRRIRQGQEVFSRRFCPAFEMTNIQDGNIGFHLQVVSVVRIRMELKLSSHFFLLESLFCYSWFSFTVDSDPL